MSWYNTSWLNRVKITVDHTKVGASLTNFPVYLDLSTLPAAFFTNVRSDGGDIRMTTSDGTTEIAREVVAIDTVGKTGEVHFNAPSLSNTVDTVFYIYYNDPSATEPAANATYGKYNVWDSNFKAVYHLEGNANDSTTNQNNGTSNTISYGTGFAKLSGQGASLNGTSSWISVPDATNLRITGNLTIESWVNPSDATPNKAMGAFIKGDVESAASADYDLVLNSRKVRMVISTGSGTNDFTGNTTMSNRAWHYIAGVYVPSTSVTLYLEGAQDAQTTSGIIAAIQSTTHAAGIGREGTNAAYFLGQYLDELRVSATNRASGWISTTYNNQNSPSTFYSLGGVENNASGALFFAQL